MTAFDFAFWVLATVAVVAALGVVLLRDLFRAALLLIVALMAVAGVYVTLHADFLAAVQVLLYAGAIAILIVFAIMLTRDVAQGNPFNSLHPVALAVSALLLVSLLWAVLATDWQKSFLPPLEPTTGPIADILFETYVLPFEIASLLLLAALVGAIVLAREK
ncbi:MAG: NADH-quinone oxidoreductase subunit J [Chloroflexi bacterium]|nr:NADH-quinone oxidoreductase subunit J [Chloroflexota bacterium]